MAIYVPNVGEKELLKDILLTQALILGLYKNPIIPDGNTTFDTLEELPSGGGRGYAAKALSNVLIVSAAAADKWFVSTNAAGKAEAQYSNAALEWVFAAADVADVNTVYGIFGYTLVLPFDAGSGEIRVGDTVTGLASGATGVATGVVLLSGAWSGTAAGYLCIKTKTGTFQNDENLQVGGVTKAVSDTGATGDAHKKLVFVESFSGGQKIDTVGQKITYVPKITLATA
ncbi:MAG: hypothetical protein QME78_00080 [Thermodesulfobacteriota bacterium]|nr:hypothetical protein [Thermodesulfobacteriota bacterium]